MSTRTELLRLAAEIDSTYDLSQEERRAYEQVYDTAENVFTYIDSAVEYINDHTPNTISPGIKLWFARAVQEMVSPMLTGHPPNKAKAIRKLDEHRRDTLGD